MCEEFVKQYDQINNLQSYCMSPKYSFKFQLKITSCKINVLMTLASV